MKNREMGRPLALDGRHLMWGHSNQPKVVINGKGGIREETRPAQNVWWTLSHCLGSQMERQKIKKIKCIVALDGCRLMIYYATTNQKQASIMEGGMKERCDEQKAQGKHNAIILGALLVDRRLKI
jgi:hypothetical protein